MAEEQVVSLAAVFSLATQRSSLVGRSVAWLKKVTKVQESLCQDIYETTADLKSSKLWSSQLWAQFKQLRIEAWKSQDFGGVWTRDLAIPVRHSNQLSYEATDQWFQASIRNCLNCVHNGDDHSLLEESLWYNFSTPRKPTYVQKCIWLKARLIVNFCFPTDRSCDDTQESLFFQSWTFSYVRTQST